MIYVTLRQVQANNNSFVYRYEEKRIKFQQQQKIADANKENVINENVDAQNSTFIKCPQLHKRISDGKEKILLLDCRSNSDFQQSKIKFDHTINIPGDVIQNGYG